MISVEAVQPGGAMHFQPRVFAARVIS